MYYFVERQTLYSRPDGLLQQIGRKKMNHEIAAKIVSEMTFSAAAYARDRSAFLTEALQRYREITGDDAPEAAAEMKAVLEQSFADRKALSVSGIDLPDHLRDGGRFRICVDGTEVTGRVRLSPKEMAEIIGCTPSAASTLLCSAKKALTKALGTHFLREYGMCA